MVGAAKRSLADPSGANGRQPCHRMNARDLQQLLPRQGRQQGRQTAGQHRFATAGRPHQQQVMATGRSNLQGPAAVGLAPHIGQIQSVANCHRSGQRQRHPWPAAASQQRQRLHQAGRWPHRQLVHQRGLRPIGIGYHQGPGPGSPGRQRHLQHPPHRPQAAVQAQLPQAPHPREGLGGQLTTGHQQPQGNRQIKAGALLAQMGRGQVHHHPGERHLQTAVAQGGTHPFARFLHRRIPQPHHLQAGQARGNIHLHGHRRDLQPQQGPTAARCQHLEPEPLP